MLNLKHTICPSCSTGCGITLISNNKELLGTYPYKRHEINEGKNCKNGRYCFTNYSFNKIDEPSIVNNGKLNESDFKSIIEQIIEDIKNVEPEQFGILCSGNSTNEELDLMKKFSESYGNRLFLYENGFVNLDKTVANYDDINNSKTILIIGDLYDENPLVARRVIMAKENGAKVICADNENKNTTSINSDKYIQFDSVSEFLDSLDEEILDELNEDAIIIFNKVDNEEDCQKISEIGLKTNAKILPIYKKCNSKGALNKIDPINLNELKEELKNIEVLLIVNENPLDYITEDDLNSIKKIVTISYFKNDIVNKSDYVIPGKPWAFKEGSYTNSVNTNQNFKISVPDIVNENLSEIEILMKISEKLDIDL